MLTEVALGASREEGQVSDRNCGEWPQVMNMAGDQSAKGHQKKTLCMNYGNPKNVYIKFWITSKDPFSIFEGHGKATDQSSSTNARTTTPIYLVEVVLQFWLIGNCS